MFSKDKKELVLFPCDSDITNYIIPDCVEKIAPSAFAQCKLQSIEIPNSVTHIGEGAFASSSLKSIVLPESIADIEKDTFRYSKLESVTLPSTLKRINDFAFCNCEKLKRVDIPEGVTSIGKSAFCFCYAIESVYIPSSVEYFGLGAFGWNHLKEMHIRIEDLGIVKEEFTDYIHKEECTLFIPYGTKYAYSNHPHFKDFYKIITED